MEIRQCKTCEAVNGIDVWNCYSCGSTLGMDTVVSRDDVDEGYILLLRQYRAEDDDAARHRIISQISDRYSDSAEASRFIDWVAENDPSPIVTEIAARVGAERKVYSRVGANASGDVDRPAGEHPEGIVRRDDGSGVEPGLRARSTKGVRRSTSPPSEKQAAQSKSLVVVFGTFGVITLGLGIWTMLAGGSDSLDVLYPGLALCGLTALLYIVVVGRRKVFHRSSAVARARVVDRSRKKVRAGLVDNTSSDGGCALVGLVLLLLLIADLFLLAMERMGLREVNYRYIDQVLVLDFEVKTPGGGKTMMLVELKVDKKIYEANPPGSFVGIRYAIDNPNVIELIDEPAT